jgi:hypothetical protein
MSTGKRTVTATPARKKMTAAKYLPSTMPVTRTGLVRSRTSVLCLCSSESRRMVRTGTAMRKMKDMFESTAAYSPLPVRRLPRAKNRPDNSRKKPRKMYPVGVLK